MSRGRSGDDLLLLGVALAVAGRALLVTGCCGALATALNVHLQNDGMVDEAINCGERHGGIREDSCPFAEGSIRRYQQAAPFVARSDQLEQCASLRLIAIHVAQIIENDQVILVELLDRALQGQRLSSSLQTLNEVGRASEQHAIAILDKSMTERCSEMRLAGPTWPEQQDIDALVQPGVTAGKCCDMSVADHRHAGEVEAAERLARRQSRCQQVSLDTSLRTLGEFEFGEGCQ